MLLLFMSPFINEKYNTYIDRLLRNLIAYLIYMVDDNTLWNKHVLYMYKRICFEMPVVLKDLKLNRFAVSLNSSYSGFDYIKVINITYYKEVKFYEAKAIYNLCKL